MILRITGTVVILLIIAVLIFIWIYRYAIGKIFRPQLDDKCSSNLIKREDISDIHIDYNGSSLNGWWYKSANSNADVIIYYYGNGQNASACMNELVTSKICNTIRKYNIVIVDYPEYGRSEGKISEESLKSFGLLVYDMVLARVKENTSIIIAGYSLGTGIACYTASNREAVGLILVAPYSDGYDLYNGKLNIFYGPLRRLVAYKMESIKYAANIDEPVLILACKDDKVIKYKTSIRLSEEFGSRCKLMSYNNIIHRDLWNNPDVIKAVENYLSDINSNTCNNTK